MNNRVVEVVDYDPIWQKTFEAEKQLLLDAIGQNAVIIEHMGSTAVKGLPSKPVIDILVAVSYTHLTLPTTPYV